MNVRDSLREVIKKSLTEFGLEQVEFDDDCRIIDHYNIDSISSIYLIVEMEKHFKIQFDDNDLLSFYNLTFNEIVALIEKLEYH